MGTQAALHTYCRHIGGGNGKLRICMAAVQIGQHICVLGAPQRRHGWHNTPAGALTNHGRAAVEHLRLGREGAQRVLVPPGKRRHQGRRGEEHEGERDEGGLLAQLAQHGVAGRKLSTQGSHKAEHCAGWGGGVRR